VGGIQAIDKHVLRPVSRRRSVIHRRVHSRHQTDGLCVVPSAELAV
jgi:hypothetical protein